MGAVGVVNGDYNSNKVSCKVSKVDLILGAINQRRGKPPTVCSFSRVTNIIRVIIYPAWYIQSKGLCSETSL